MEKRPPRTAPPKNPSLSSELATPRLVLRPPRPSDVPALRAHLRRSAEHLRPFSPAPYAGDDPSSLTSLSKTVLRQRSDWKRGTSYAFVVFEAERREAVAGRVTLGTVARGVFQSSYLGYEVDVDVAGRGIATEAVGAVVDFGFRALELHRVQAAIMPGNARSLRVVEKLGFRREGFAERYLCIANVWEDHVLFARTAEEWVAARST